MKIVFRIAKIILIALWCSTTVLILGFFLGGGHVFHFSEFETILYCIFSTVAVTFIFRKIVFK